MRVVSYVAVNKLMSLIIGLALHSYGLLAHLQERHLGISLRR